MMQVVRSGDRYHVENEWLSSYWHFSFDHYNDPANVSFGPLRVFNHDAVAALGGFPLHPHREMEIVTYLIDGQIEHQDTLGNRGTISAGEVQRMTAGTGIRHSEFNPSATSPAHLVQLWFLPAVPRLTPSWEQKRYPLEARAGRLLPIVVPKGSGPSAGHAVEIHQDATMFTSLLAPGESTTHVLAPGRRAYLFVVHGELQANGELLRSGDQGRITAEREVSLVGPALGSNLPAADFLLLDLP